MADVFYAEHLNWDDWNLEHITKHDVVREEAEEVIFGGPVVFKSYKERLVLIGPTSLGRMLAVIVGAVPGSSHVYYVFSARPASRKERRYYEQQKNSTLH
jgi:uncharacterized DUF497 family protein